MTPRFWDRGYYMYDPDLRRVSVMVSTPSATHVTRNTKFSIYAEQLSVETWLMSRSGRKNLRSCSPEAGVDMSIFTEYISVEVYDQTPKNKLEKYLISGGSTKFSKI
jgi:hypothetical protein